MRDIPRSHVKNLVVSMCALAFDYCNGMITVKRYAEGNPTDTPMEEAVAESGGGQVVKGGSKLILLDESSPWECCAPPQCTRYTRMDGTSDACHYSLPQSRAGS